MELWVLYSQKAHQTAVPNVFSGATSEKRAKCLQPFCQSAKRQARSRLMRGCFGREAVSRLSKSRKCYFDIYRAILSG